MAAALLPAPTTTYRTADFLAAAQRLGLVIGVDLIVATDRCHVLASDFTEQARATAWYRGTRRRLSCWRPPIRSASPAC